jgi:hypothetical protein
MVLMFAWELCVLFSTHEEEMAQMFARELYDVLL